MNVSPGIEQTHCCNFVNQSPDNVLEGLKTLHSGLVSIGPGEARVRNPFLTLSRSSLIPLGAGDAAAANAATPWMASMRDPAIDPTELRVIVSCTGSSDTLLQRQHEHGVHPGGHLLNEGYI